MVRPLLILVRPSAIIGAVLVIPKSLILWQHPEGFMTRQRKTRQHEMRQHKLRQHELRQHEMRQHKLRQHELRQHEMRQHKLKQREVGQRKTRQHRMKVTVSLQYYIKYAAGHSVGSNLPEISGERTYDHGICKMEL